MTGYCEACQREATCENDEYGVAVCLDCGHDVAIDIHIDSEFDEPEMYEPED